MSVSPLLWVNISKHVLGHWQSYRGVVPLSSENSLLKQCVGSITNTLPLFGKHPESNGPIKLVRLMRQQSDLLKLYQTVLDGSFIVQCYHGTHS